MVNPSASPEATPILQLLADYSFDTDNCRTETVVAGWLQQFDAAWVSQAITEALYQGRYKLVSVEHILQLWQRRGHPLRHFNREFESIILGQTLLCPPPLPDVSRPALVKPLAQATPAASPEDTAQPDLTPGQEEVAVQRPELDVFLQEAVPEEAVAVATAQAAESPLAEGIPRFRPLTPDLSSELATTWASAESIQPFVPQLESSEFHQRLKAVVDGTFAEN